MGLLPRIAPRHPMDCAIRIGIGRTCFCVVLRVLTPIPVMGDNEPGEDYPLTVAEVFVRTSESDTDVRRINFLKGAFEIISEAVAGA